MIRSVYPPFVAALCVMLSWGPALAAEATQPPKPNIVIILADDMGFSDLGCYGGEIQTPHLDQLAAGGLRFTQFYNTARCCPTRAALLTGLYSHQAGVGLMTRPIGDFPGYRADLSHDAVTLAEALKPAGYSTYMAGKWHLTLNEGPKGPKNNWPRQRGFDRFYGTIKGGGSYFDPALLTRDNTPITPASDPEYKPEAFYYTDALADQSARFIREHQAKARPDGTAAPFLLYTAFTSPHWPLHAPPDAVAKYKGKYDAGYEPVRAARFERMKAMGLIDGKWPLSPAPLAWNDVENKAWEARCMEVYAAQVDRMDAGIGRIVDALKDTRQLDNTLILFLADNGGCAETVGREAHEDRTNAEPIAPRAAGKVQVEVFPRHTSDGRPVKDGTVVMPGADDTYIAYGMGWANVSTTPFREYKHFSHEGGISTPLIAHWPAGIAIARHGEWEIQPGHLVDLMATCVDLADAHYPETKNGKAVIPMQGVSLRPAFEGKSLGRSAPIFFEHEGNRAVRDGDWKLVARGADGAWELYDMASDRTEMNDLATAQPDRVKTLAAAWQKWAETSDVLPLNPGAAARAKSRPRGE